MGFINSIMEMISNNALDLNDISIEKEKAPIHMTDMVIDDIEIKLNQSHSLIGKKDFQKIAVIIDGVIAYFYHDIFRIITLLERHT